MIKVKKCVIVEYILSKEREEETMAKKQRDIGKIATKIIALILAILMVLAVAGTLIYYLVVL